MEYLYGGNMISKKSLDQLECKQKKGHSNNNKTE